MLLNRDWMALLQENQVGKVVETNRATAQYGLTLTEEEAKLILRERTNPSFGFSTIIFWNLF